jgi:hypothetical protein
MHGISPLLSGCLRWQGPDAWTTFLREQRTHTAARHLRIQAVLAAIGDKARGAGIAVTPLKGSALHELGLYAAGDRPMADIDLLVRPAVAARTAELLVSLGFCESGATWKERVFAAVDESAPAECGEHSDNSVKIELHERICEKLPWRITDASDFIFPARPHPGLNAYPSNGALMHHLLLHAAGSMAFRGLRILQLHDMALLADRMSASDWDEIAVSNAEGAQMWWAFPPLELLSRYYESKVPARVLEVVHDECSYFLRALAMRKSLVEVSYSHLWVEAFPGIEWSQSIPELLAFAASRVRPSAEHLAHRNRVAITQTWARDDKWSSMSQGRRIFRWLTSRQIRPMTMHTISAAFSQGE